MKKIIILGLIIITTLNFSFAEEGVINSILENKNSAIREIKSFFSGSKTELKQEEILEIKSKTLITEDPVINTELITKENTKIETKVKKEDLKIVLVVCENKNKINLKKEKINNQIKNQIKDKNKLTDKLLEISSGISTSSKELIDEKIIKLETEVSNAIKIQKGILNIIASSTDSICDTVPVSASASTAVLTEARIKRVEILKESKEYANLNKNIKKLELDTEKQLEKINNIIKKDIKNLLVEINSIDSN